MYFDLWEGVFFPPGYDDPAFVVFTWICDVAASSCGSGLWRFGLHMSFLLGALFVADLCLSKVTGGSEAVPKVRCGVCVCVCVCVCFI